MEFVKAFFTDGVTLTRIEMCLKKKLKECDSNKRFCIGDVINNYVDDTESTDTYAMVFWQFDLDAGTPEPGVGSFAINMQGDNYTAASATLNIELKRLDALTTAEVIQLLEGDLDMSNQVDVMDNMETTSDKASAFERWKNSLCTPVE